MRAWGLYLIPRDKAPDEGWLITKGYACWRAWRLPIDHDGIPLGKAYRYDHSVEELVDNLMEDHIM